MYKGKRPVVQYLDEVVKRLEACHAPDGRVLREWREVRIKMLCSVCTFPHHLYIHRFLIYQFIERFPKGTAAEFVKEDEKKAAKDRQYKVPLSFVFGPSAQPVVNPAAEAIPVGRFSEVGMLEADDTASVFWGIEYQYRSNASPGFNLLCEVIYCFSLR